MDEAINKGDFLNITEGGVPHQYMCINQLFATEEKIKKEKVRLFLRLQKEQRGALTSAVKLGLITETKEEYVAANNKYVDTSKLDQIQEFKWRIFKSILQDENAKPYTLKKRRERIYNIFYNWIMLV